MTKSALVHFGKARLKNVAALCGLRLIANPKLALAGVEGRSWASAVRSARAFANLQRPAQLSNGSRRHTIVAWRWSRTGILAKEMALGGFPGEGNEEVQRRLHEQPAKNGKITTWLNSAIVAIESPSTQDAHPNLRRFQGHSTETANASVVCRVVL